MRLVRRVSRYIDHSPIIEEVSSDGGTVSVLEAIHRLGLGIYFMLLTCLGLSLALTNVLDNVPVKAELIDYFMILTSILSSGLLVFVLVETALYRREHNRRMSTSSAPIDVPEAEEGLNFLLRIGVIFFSMAAVILNIISIIANVLQNDSTWHSCVAGKVCEIVFYMLQSYFIFKYHRIIFHRRPFLMRFVLMHLITINVCNWFRVATNEAHYLFAVYGPKTKKNITVKAVSASNTSDTITDKLLEFSDEATIYLYPCIIEYAVLSAAALINMYRRVNTKQHKSDTNANRDNVSVAMNQRSPGLDPDLVTIGKQQHMCAKSHTGLFLGAFVAAIYIVYIACCKMLKSKVQNHRNLSPFEILAIFSEGFGLAIVIALFVRMIRRLDFKPHLDLFVDRLLMNISFYANVFFTVFILLADCHHIAKTDQEETLAHNVMIIIKSIVEALQYFSQTIFILVGINLRAGRGVDNKPGNTLLMVLLALNLMMWVDESLLLKADLAQTRYTMFYGRITWFLLIGICKPTVVFYRFHSATMLAEMWTHVYRKE